MLQSFWETSVRIQFYLVIHAFYFLDKIKSLLSQQGFASGDTDSVEFAFSFFEKIKKIFRGKVR